MIVQLSNKHLHEMWLDAISDGYLGRIATCYKMIIQYNDAMTDNDKIFILDCLSFCYQYAEYDSKIDYFELLHPDYTEQWEQLIEFTDNWHVPWLHAMVSGVQYFGHNKQIENAGVLVK